MVRIVKCDICGKEFDYDVEGKNLGRNRGYVFSCSEECEKEYKRILFKRRFKIKGNKGKSRLPLSNGNLDYIY
jgi:predicted RNA-binding protein YlxR (DUF448 family)